VRVRNPDGSPTSITPLSDASTTNWLLTAHPDIYLYATLLEATPFLIEDARVPLWETELQKRLEELSGSVRVDPARSGLGLSSYATLLRTVADYLNRGDLAAIIPTWVVAAERAMSRDQRVRNLSVANYSITGDDLAVPAGFRELVSLAYDGPTYFGPIEIVGADQLGALKARYGTSGVPQFAAIVDAKLRFAPAPNATYATKMTFWQTVTALSAGTNWLYTSHPDVYLYAVLCEAAPYLGVDPRVELWKMELDRRLEEIHQDVWSRHWGGTMVRQFTPIGG
jgi:hypothetical protein